MAIDTKDKRNASLKDAVAIVFPSGITIAGRQTLVGDYKPVSATPPTFDATRLEIVEAPR